MKSKSLLMVLISLIATIVTQHGLPKTKETWIVLGITVLGTILTHYAQSKIITTTSELGTINLLDLLKGSLISLGTFLSGIGASYIMEINFDWHQFLEASLGVVTGYLAKQFIEYPRLKDNTLN